MNFDHVASIAIFGVILWGFANRHDRRIHVPAMAAAFALDVALVVWIEISREAVEKSLGLGGRPLPGPLLGFHIFVSVLVILLYIVQAVLGRRLLSGNESVRAWHRKSGMTFLLARSLNLVTSFMI
jgi:uncharacterized membrane protein YozB (DUF420 family)